MTDDNKGQDPEQGNDKGTFSSVDDLPEFWKSELENARSEAAERRVKLKNIKQKYDSLEEKVNRLENQEELDELERIRQERDDLKTAKEARDAEYERMQKEYQFVSFAAQMGVSPEVAQLIDVSKLDLDDEEALKQRLKPLQQKKMPSGGDPSNPSGGDDDTLTDAEKLSKYFKPGGRGVDKAFGG